MLNVLEAHVLDGNSEVKLVQVPAALLSFLVSKLPARMSFDDEELGESWDATARRTEAIRVAIEGAYRYMCFIVYY